MAKKPQFGGGTKMTAGAGNGVGRLQKAGMPAKGYSEGGTVMEGKTTTGQVRGAGKAVRGKGFNGVY